MSPRILLILFDGIYLVALGALVGSVLFFSFGIAPRIFRVLDAGSSARFVRALFPRYYAWGATAGAVALPAMLCGPLCFPNDLRGPMLGIQALGLLAVILIFFYCGNSLTPAINAARDAGPEAAGRFERLHRRGVVLNGVVLFLGVALLTAHAARPTPKSAGIVEMTPQERARRDYEDLVRRTAAYEARKRAATPGGAERPR